MAEIASRAQIIQIEPQVRPVSYGNLVVGMQMAFTPVVSVAKLGEHSLDGRVAKTVSAEGGDNIRFPTTINTLPSVPLETEDPQPAVMRIVTAVTARTAMFIVFTLSDAPV